VGAAGIGTAGDDAEIGARLFQRLRIDVGLGGRLLDVGDLLRATRKLVLEELLCPLAAVGFWCRRLGGFTWLAAGLGGQILARVDCCG
jgi:hypothetical protein